MAFVVACLSDCAESTGAAAAIIAAHLSFSTGRLAVWNAVPTFVTAKALGTIGTGHRVGLTACAGQGIVVGRNHIRADALVKFAVIVERVAWLAGLSGAGVDAFVAIVVVVTRLAWIPDAIAGRIVANEALVTEALAGGLEATACLSLGTEPRYALRLGLREFVSLQQSAREVFTGIADALTSVIALIESKLRHAFTGTSGDECFDIITFHAHTGVASRLDIPVSTACRYIEAIAFGLRPVLLRCAAIGVGDLWCTTVLGGGVKAAVSRTVKSGELLRIVRLHRGCLLYTSPSPRD